MLEYDLRRHARESLREARFKEELKAEKQRKHKERQRRARERWEATRGKD